MYNNLWKGSVSEYNKMLDEQNTAMYWMQVEIEAEEKNRKANPDKYLSSMAQ